MSNSAILKGIKGTLNTSGTGYWSDVAKKVKVTKIEVDVWKDEWCLNEMKVYFSPKTWDIRKHGLIYTDPRFLRELKKALRAAGYDPSDVAYSEQGMQGRDYVSLDVGRKFTRSVLKINPKHLILEE